MRTPSLLDRSLRLDPENGRRHFGASSVGGHLVNGVEMFNRRMALRSSRQSQPTYQPWPLNRLAA